MRQPRRIGLGQYAASSRSSGSGGVSGPSSAVVDNAIVRFDGTGGAAVQAGAAILNDDGRISFVTDPTSAQDAATKAYVDAASGTPGGSDTQIQFNDSGVFGGSAEMVHGANLSSSVLYNNTIANLGLQRAVVNPFDNASGIFSELNVTPGVDTSYVIGSQIAASADGSTDLARLWGSFNYAAYLGTGDIGQFIGQWNAADSFSATSSTIDKVIGTVSEAVVGAGVTAPFVVDYMAGSPTYSQVISGTVAAFYHFCASQLDISGGAGFGNITTAVQFYGGAIGGSATNAYSFWSDEQGVFRIRADNTFNSVYQAIPALYNPQFTKYTAGAANHERVVLQWESNVATVRTEAGGTGTLRALNLGGSAVTINGVTAVTTTGAQALTNKTGNISQWTNDSAYLTSVTAHNLLSATHGDTTAGSVARGDLITGQGASPKWVRLAKGTANQVLAMDGTATDVTWITLSGGGDATVAGGLAQFSAALTDVTTNNASTSAHGFLKKLSTIATEYMDGTGNWSVPAGGAGGDALVANPLSQFAATTSLQLKGVISDETGSGALVFATAPALTGPVTLAEAVGSSALAITGATQTASFPALSITQTWNNSGVTFNGVLVNVTNTASAAASRLFTMQVGSADRTFFPRTGGMSFYSNINAGRIGIDDSNFGVIVSSSSQDDFWFSSTSLRAKSSLTMGWSSSSTTAVAGLDLILGREGAAILQMGADVNGAAVAQTLKACDGITGTDRTGGNFTLSSGIGTGAGAVSSVLIQTPTVLASGTTAQTNTTRVTISSASLLSTVIGIYPATTTAAASLRLPHGTAPTSPVDGDLWTTSAGLYVRINGATVGPLS